MNPESKYKQSEESMNRPDAVSPVCGAAVRRTLLAAIILLSAAAGIGCHNSQANNGSAAADAGTPVETRPATRGDAVRWTAVTGSLVSLQDVSLSCKIPGRLAEVYVRQGEPVEKGQVVARIDMSDQESQRRSAEAAFAAARARVEQAGAAYREQLVSSNSALEAAEAAFNLQRVNTKTGIQSAEAGLEAAKAQLSQVREGSRTQEIRRGQAAAAVAQANLAKAEADLHRYRQLADEGAISKSTLEQFETADQVARENLKAAQEAVSLLKEGARTQEVTQAEQGVRQAEERLRQARAATALDQVRHADVVTARAALAQNDVRRADVSAAKAALQQAESQLAMAEKALADSSVRSPIRGQIAGRTAEPGQIVGAGTPILRVVGLDSVYFEPSIPDRDMSYVRVGQPVEVTVNAIPGRRFIGNVTRLYPAASARSRAFPVRITIANTNGLLRPEMFAQGRIQSEMHRAAVQVPIAAVLRKESDSGDDTHGRLFTVVDGVAHEHAVTIGLTSADGSRVEVSGIEMPAEVVVSGQRGLTEGDRVTAEPTPAIQTAAAAK
jgi:RND family efflux transporter MFP subunit